jgi:hypothetical protein
VAKIVIFKQQKNFLRDSEPLNRTSMKTRYPGNHKLFFFFLSLSIITVLISGYAAFERRSGEETAVSPVDTVPDYSPVADSGIWTTIKGVLSCPTSQHLRDFVLLDVTNSSVGKSLSSGFRPLAIPARSLPENIRSGSKVPESHRVREVFLRQTLTKKARTSTRAFPAFPRSADYA